MRYAPIALWAAATFVLLLIVTSDFAFGKGDTKIYLQRIALAFVWPLAALSRPGRDLLFNYGSKL